MRINEIDKFRENFFDKVIQEQKEKEKDKKRIQQNCSHHYELLEQYQNSYQKKICSKCENIDIKHYRVWEGTKHCIIS